MSNKLGLQDFAPYVHGSFRVTSPEGYELRLAEATDLSREQMEQFSLIFTCPVLPWLPQGMYTLVPPANEEHSEIALFLVPIGPNEEGMRYEAVFSRVGNGSRARGGGSQD
jgi:hypothetical protein